MIFDSHIITIVYSDHWKVIDAYEGQDELYRYKTIEGNGNLIKIFYKLDDAISYINSVPGQSFPPDWDELQRNGLSDERYDNLEGFYLYQQQYPIE